MGQNVKATVISFLTSLEKNDLNSSILILDEVMASIQVEEFSKTLKHHILLNEYPHKFYLKIRDCFADYLGFGPVYFALLQPSYDIFRMVSSAKSRSEAQELLADFVISSVQKGVSQIDLSFLEIDSLTKPPYVLLVPYLLSTRATELETCRIPFSLQSSSIRQNSRYCLTDLLRTHYGRKIVSAFEFDSDYPVVGFPGTL